MSLGETARGSDAHGRVRRALRDAGEQSRALLVAGVEPGPSALEVDDIDELRRRRLRPRPLEQLRRGLVRADAARQVGGPPQGRHDRGVTARRSLQQVLGDALVLNPVVGEQGGCARMHLGHVRFADRLARRRCDQRVRERASVGVEHPLGAQLRLGGDRVAAARVRRAREPGSRRRRGPGRRRRSRSARAAAVSRSSRSPTSRTSCGGGRLSLMSPTPPARACWDNSRR